MELFEEKSWTGEFFIPNDYPNRFVGTIEYSPKNGVILSCSITGLPQHKESKILHGILSIENNKCVKCTLIGGQFSVDNTMPGFNNGLTYIRKKIGFSCLLVGTLFDENESVDNINFSLTNLQEFFFPKGWKDSVKYSKKPLFRVQTSYGQIKIGNNASFKYLNKKDIAGLIYSRNTEVLKELQDCFTEIDNKYPNNHFMLKEDITYRISLTFDNGTSIEDAYGHITELSNLFALLICSPVYPDSIRFTKSENDLPCSIEIYPSMGINPRTKDICIKAKSNFHMPITNASIDLASVIDNWLKVSKNYSTIVSSIQNDMGFRYEHSLHGEIVLYATQFESIANEEKIKKAQCYEYTLNKYGSSNIKNGIKNIFAQHKENDIGKAIGHLRDEIAHVGRPKKLLSSLSLEEMAHIADYLFLTIVGCILRRIGIDEAVIEVYQNRFA